MNHSQKLRAVVTGFCAAHPLLNRTRAAWIEYSSANAPDLRDLFCAAPRREYSAHPSAAWWERFFASGIIGELKRVGIWRDGSLLIEPARVGICVSSSKGRPALLEKTNEYSFDAACDWAAREVLKLTGARGKTMCPVAACASGAHAIALAVQWIEDDLCDAVICGALEAELAPLVLAGYKSLGALSTQSVMRPFDANRDGFVPSVGGAILVLENEELARARSEKNGAKIWGRVAGHSMKCDATSLTGMDVSGEPIARAMRDALGALSTHDVDYINAHGTATRHNDAIEARAIETAFGGSTPVSSTKALTGHLLGAAGAVEAVLCLLAMNQNFAPPNLNLENVDAACAGIDVLKSGREMEIERALSLSYGFGGHIGVLVLEKI